MKPSEILEALPKWSNATAAELLASPAWSMPCRFGDEQCAMRLDAVHPGDAIDLAIRLEGDDHVLRIADSPSFPDLHALWAERASMPEAVLLALVEKECGPLLQLLENAVRRQLSVVGFAPSAPSADESMIYARVVGADGQDKASFALTATPAVTAVLGSLRFIDVAHPAVRDESLSVEREFAAFSFPAADASTIEVGDSVLLPEVGTVEPRFVVDGRFIVAGNTVSEWKDDGMYRAVAAELDSVTLGALFDIATGASSLAPSAPPAPGTQLRLVRLGKPVASGRLSQLGAQAALAVDVVGA